MAWLEEEGVFVTRLGHFRGQIGVEDVAFFVTAYDPRRGTIHLSDRTTERLQTETLRVDPDGAFRCAGVKGRFEARFTQAGQAHLLASVEERGDIYVLRAGDRLAPLPRACLGG